MKARLAWSLVEDRARLARNATARARKRGALAPLGINPETGKRYIGTGRHPTSGTRTPGLMPSVALLQVDLSHRFRSRRERANELRGRMAVFSRVYNAGYLVRDSYFGPDVRRREMVERFLATFAEEARSTQDFEALLFAVVDTLVSSPHGLPWEP